MLLRAAGDPSLLEQAMVQGGSDGRTMVPDRGPRARAKILGGRSGAEESAGAGGTSGAGANG